MFFVSCCITFQNYVKEFRFALLNVKKCESVDMLSTSVLDKEMNVLITISRDPDWWRARHLTRGDKGHIPRNYVASLSSIECEE